MSWSTGFYSIAPNLQAPYYPNATQYAPQFPFPGSVQSMVRGASNVSCQWHARR